mmetsp:Transcript_87223/g.167740  ORF Transcript_87223/g.167740 Transcript_87223/m.167740 type:complete len:115 (+) Transcript_87223:126-470(+)
MLAPSASTAGGTTERGGSATTLRAVEAPVLLEVEVDAAAAETPMLVLLLPAFGCCLVALPREPAGGVGLLSVLGWFLPWRPPAVDAEVPFWRFRPNGIPKLGMTGSNAGGDHRH